MLPIIRLGLTSIDVAFNYSASANSYTDETSDLSSSNAGDVNVFSSTCVNVGDAVYFGHTYNRFARISGSVSTPAAACPVTVYEYYNGTAWRQLSDVTDEFDWKTSSSQDFIIAASHYDQIRRSWQKTSVCGVSAYYIRARCASVSGGGSGATLTSASADISLPSPIPNVQLVKKGRLFEFLDGSIGFDEQATKRVVTLNWSALDKDDANSLRERIELQSSTCMNFPANWNEDNAQLTVIVDPRTHSDLYVPSALHTVIVNFLEV